MAHNKGRFRRSIHSNLTGRSLDEIASCCHREDRRFPYILRGVQQTCFKNDFEVMLAAYSLQFGYLIVALLIASLEELAHTQHDIYLGCASTQGQSGLCHLHLQKTLAAWEYATHASDVELRVLERFAYVFSHRRINADSSHIRYAREIFLEIVHGVRHLLHLSNGVIGAQRGVVNLMETLFPHLYIVILRKMLCLDVSHLSLYLLIGKRAGILRK